MPCCLGAYVAVCPPDPLQHIWFTFDIHYMDIQCCLSYCSLQCVVLSAFVKFCEYSTLHVYRVFLFLAILVLRAQLLGFVSAIVVNVPAISALHT